MRTETFGLMAAAALLAASAGTAVAGGPTVYFGQDLHNSDTVPLPVGMRTNSTAASNNFFGGLAAKNLVGITTSFEASEGFTANNVFAPPPMAGDVGFNPLVSFPDSGGTTAQITNGVVRFQTPGVAGPGGNPGQDPSIPQDGRYPTTGTHYLSAAITSGMDSLMLQFNTPQVAFSFWGVDIGDFEGDLILTLADGSGEMMFPVNHTAGTGGSTSGSVLFWGIIDCDNPFTSIRFRNTGDTTDRFAFDDFTIAFERQTLIPLPTAVGLGLAGLGAIAARRRRVG